MHTLQAQTIFDDLRIMMDGDVTNPRVFSLHIAQELSAQPISRLIARGSMSGMLLGEWVRDLDSELTFQSAKALKPGEQVEITLSQQGRIGLDTSKVLRFRVPAGASLAAFHSTHHSTFSQFSQAITLGDLNRDGYLDIITGNTRQDNTNRILLNDGFGNFIDGPSIPTEGNTWAIDLSDVDSDNDLDIIIANGKKPNVIYLNDGTGYFPESQQFGTGTDSTSSLAIGDLDADGDSDIVAGNGDGYQMGRSNKVYFNDGKGIFTEVPIPLQLDTRAAGTKGRIPSIIPLKKL